MPSALRDEFAGAIDQHSKHGKSPRPNAYLNQVFTVGYAKQPAAMRGYTEIPKNDDFV